MDRITDHVQKFKEVGAPGSLFFAKENFSGHRKMQKWKLLLNIAKC